MSLLVKPLFTKSSNPAQATFARAMSNLKTKLHLLFNARTMQHSVVPKSVPQQRRFRKIPERRD